MADLLVRRCIVLVAALIGCAPGPAPVPDLPLVGSWVRVYPPDGALDTLVLHANGAVAGSTRGLGTYDFKLARWKIGHKLMPGGLAVGDGTERAAVMAYVVSGDTLWLANRLQAAFLRLPSNGSRAEIQVWQTPKGTAAPPRAGEGVVAPPAGFTKKGA